MKSIMRIMFVHEKQNNLMIITNSNHFWHICKIAKSES